MSSNASQLFDVFVEAKSALEELPKVKADLETMSALAHETEGKLTLEQSLHDAAKAELDRLRAAFAQKEAELAQLTFQHETIKNALGHIISIGHSVSDRSDPEPEHKPVSVTSEASPSNPSDQNPPPADANSATATSSNAPSSAPASETVGSEPQSLPQPSTSPAPSDPSVTPPLNSGAKAGEDREPQGEGDAQSDGTFKPIAPANNATEPPIASTENPSTVRHIPRHHWEKPYDVTWQSWGDLGNEVPEWITDRSWT